MNSNSKLSYAIAAILGSAPAGFVQAATATDAAASDSEAIQEITVTAQRRDESIENVPITIQAITGDTLKSLNVQTFDDLIKYTPNVSYSGNGPGLGNIFVRGLSSGGSGNQSQSTTAPFPNVAVYLDDESLQFPARNLDVYLVDMERVEVLEGPQGTLFGGGAQAGALRYITNKPKLDVTEGNANASYGITASGGDPNSALNATINLPLIADTLAVRATIFDDHRGGYISNVPGTNTLPASVCVAASCPTASNGALVGSDLNTVDYTGARIALLWKINENWNALVSQNYQNMKSDGYFDDYPISSSGTPLAPYQITAFSPAYDKDKYEATSWTLNGTFGDLFGYGPLKMVYTGSYLDRNIDQQHEYSNYLKSGGGSSYACSGAGSNYFTSKKAPTCYAPVGNWRDQVKTTHESHELRLSTSDDNRWRGLLGAYWEKFVIDDNMNFNYLAIPQCSPANLAIANAGGPDCVSAVGPIPGNYASDPGLREGANTAFGEDAQRGYKQTAFFLSTDFDIIPKVLTITGGTRYFHYDEFEHGSEYYSESAPAIDTPNGQCTDAGGCGFGINKSKTENGFKSRGNLTWHVTPDTMVYYTYSQGFRPGGFNRSTDAATAAYTCATGNRDAGNCKGSSENQYYKPNGFDSDDLVNNEIGVKSEFLDHRVQINASAYRMKWSNVQLPLFDPTGLGNTTFVVNGPTYVVKGLEVQLVARVTEALTIQGSSSYNNSKQTNSPCLISDVPTTAKNTNPTPLGDCITQIKNSPYVSPFGIDGTTPAYSPLEQFNLRARYDWTFGDYKPFAMVGANHVGSMRNEPASFPSGSSSFCSPQPTTTLCLYTMPGYTTYDAAIGVAKDNWTAQLSGANLSNSNASQNTSSGGFIESMVPLRPRVLTATIGYKF